MNWVEIAWIMMVSASLTLGAIHLLVWLRQRTQYTYLWFFVLASSAAAFGVFELAMMNAETPAAYAGLLRSAQVALFVFATSLVAFVHFFFNAGRAWLAFAVVGVRAATLIVNFTTGVNVNFEAITGLDHLEVWGVDIAFPVGVPSRWNVLAQTGNLLLIAYMIDAAVSLWRRGDAAARRRAVLVGGSLVFCVFVASILGVLLMVRLVRAPTVVTPVFFVVVLAMAYELGWEVLAAAELATRLRISEERFRSVVESAPNAILLVDAAGAITLANAQAERSFGCRREELVGRVIETLLPARLHDLHVALRADYAAHPVARPMGVGRELLARRTDGQEFPVEVSLNPMRSGDKLFVLVSLVDVTERKKSERTAARQRDELAHLSRVAMLGELSGSLAHELNQPLTAILSNAQAAQRFLARSPPQLESVAEILADIVKSDRRAGAVIERLRSMLRKEEAERRPLALNDVVQESLQLMRSDLVNRQVVLRTELEPALAAISGDRVQLQQVLLNLVINGCDAMDGQTSDRNLLVRTRSNGNGAIEVAVADCGTGIAEDDLERVFEPFVTTKARGMGLGLAICRTIVEAHGGRLWATNNAGRGATLHFELPRHGL
jgi:PAS domain S-box-containing protein